MTFTRLPTHAACLALLAPLSAPAVAAEPDAATLPEVTVTAERTEAIGRRTPVSVVVVDARDMQRKGVSQLNDLVGVVAGVTVPNGYSNMPQAVGIRGVGVSLAAMSQAVGISIDDVPLIRGYATALWDLPDIARIEVLRGPQGTLYGQNLTAGAVKYISLDPGAEPTAWVSLGAGNHSAYEARGYASGAVGDGPLAASLAVSRRANGGFGHNAALNSDVNRLDATQFRAKLKWHLTPDSDAVLAIDGLRDKSDTNTFNYPLNHPQSAPRVTYTTAEAGAFERLAGGVSLRLTHRPRNGLVLRSITALRAYKDDPTVADWGGLEQQRYTLSQVIEQQAFSQEFQVQGRDGGRTWTSGTMLVTDRFDFDRVSTVVPVATPMQTHARTHQRTDDVGVYGQVRQPVGERSGLTAGLRWYHTRQTASNAFERNGTAVYAADDLRTSKTGLLPRIGFDHAWSADTFLYTTLAQGAKFGGYNRAAESARSAEVATRPEKVTTLEAGSKSRLLDGRVNANVALFYNDYRDYLAALNNTTVNGTLVADAVLVNAGRAHTYGVDVDVTAQVTRDIDASASVELLRTRFDAFENPTGAAGSNFVGHELPNAPRATLGATLGYREPLVSGAAVRADVSVQHLRQQYSDAGNTPALRIPTQTYLNAGASYVTASQHWTFSVRVRNLLDKTYVLLHNNIPSLGIDAAYYNPPRTVMLTARYDL